MSDIIKTSANETQVHKWMKEYAANILKKRGCNRIEFEYPIMTREGNRLIIDVVGFKDENKRYAVECGNTGELKLERLEDLFDEVINLSYVDFLTILINENKMLKEQLEQRPTPIILDGKEVRSINLDFLSLFGGKRAALRFLDSEGNIIKELPIRLPSSEKKIVMKK